MSPLDFTHILTQAVDELSESESYKGLFHRHTDGNPLPSAKVLCDIIELARSIIFPGYFGNSTVNSRTVTYHIGVNVERLFDLLSRQVLAGLCFGNDDGSCSCTGLQREEAALLAAKFIGRLPELRRNVSIPSGRHKCSTWQTQAFETTDTSVRHDRGRCLTSQGNKLKLRTI